MMRLIVFGVLQAIVLGYAFWSGRWPERFAALATSMALVAGWLLPFHGEAAYQHVEIGPLAIDVALLAALLLLVAKADRYWPIWLASIQVLAIGFHGVRAYDEALLPIIYNRLVGWLGYPMLFLMVAGIWRDHRRQLKMSCDAGPDAGAPGQR